jgi:hypothetical protein
MMINPVDLLSQGASTDRVDFDERVLLDFAMFLSRSRLMGDALDPTVGEEASSLV